MVRDLVEHSDPFAFFTCEDVFGDSELAWLDSAHAQQAAWQLHEDSFYRAYLADIAPVPFRAELIERMRSVTRLPLSEDLRLTIQRMEPGQYAEPHTDRPLVGYEAARLIVQLTRNWTPEDGGALHLHPDEAGAETRLRRGATRNTGFGFVMGPRSFHSVQPVLRRRRTAVFNFFHIGNPPQLAAWVQAQFEGIHFGSLPLSVAPLALAAETELPEEHSFRAAHVAHLLQRWGFDDATIAEGFAQGLEPLREASASAPILLSRWVERLRHGDFDAALWDALRGAVSDGDPRLDAVRCQAFGFA